MQRVLYLPRVIWTLFWADLPCGARWCGRPTILFSMWCREHTDRILEDRTTPDMGGAYRKEVTG